MQLSRPMQENIDLLPIELLRRILVLRTHLCYQIRRDSWKKEWRKNITLVNQEYHLACCWGDNSLHFPSAIYGHPWKKYNWRRLSNPQVYHESIFTCRMVSHSKLGILHKCNFLMMHYFYSLRSDFECKDWFLRFLESKRYV